MLFPYTSAAYPWCKSIFQEMSKYKSRCQRCGLIPLINLYMYSHFRINYVYLLSDWSRPWISYLLIFEYGFDYRFPIVILTSIFYSGITHVYTRSNCLYRVYLWDIYGISNFLKDIHGISYIFIYVHSISPVLLFL